MHTKQVYVSNSGKECEKRSEALALDLLALANEEVRKAQEIITHPHIFKSLALGNVVDADAALTAALKTIIDTNQKRIDIFVELIEAVKEENDGVGS